MFDYLHPKVYALHILLKQVIKDTGARGAGVYEYDSHSRILRLIAAYDESDKPLSAIGSQLAFGEGLAGNLMAGDKEFRIVDNYEESEYHSSVFAEHIFGSVLEIKIRQAHDVLGILYINDDTLQLKFNKTHVEQITPVMTLVGGILAEAEELQLNIRPFVRLSEASNLAMDAFTEKPLADRLAVIVEEAAKVINCESCGVFLIRDPKYLNLIASWGHRVGTFFPNMRFKIADDKASGLTGAIAARGVPYNQYGETLWKDNAIKSRGASHTVSKQCYSLLMLPLRRKQSQEIIGWIRADNKTDLSKRPGPFIGFTKNDEAVLEIFSDIIVASIDAVELGEDLQTIIDIIPDYIFAKDVSSRFLLNNKSHQNLLRVKSVDEVRGRTDFDFFSKTDAQSYYENEQEVIHSGQARGNVREEIHNDNGELLQVLLTTQVPLFDHSTGKIRGLVGISRDVTKIEKSQKLLRDLSKASQQLLVKRSVEDLLQLVADLACNIAHAKWSSIIIKEEASKPAYQKTSGNVEPNKMLSRVRSNGLTMLAINSGMPIYISNTETYNPDDYRGILMNPIITDENIRAIACLPLETTQRTVCGVLWLHYQTIQEFSEEERQALEVFAGQAAGAYENMKLINWIQKEKEVAEHAASLAPLDKDETLTNTVQLIYDILGCGPVILFEYDSLRKEIIIPPKAVNVKYEQVFKPRGSHSLIYHLLNKNEPTIVPDISENELFREREFAKVEDVKSCAAFPLRSNNERFGVLFVNYCEKHAFTENDIRTINLFADQAALTIASTQAAERAGSRADTLRELYDTFALQHNGYQLLVEITNRIVRLISKNGQIENCFGYVATCQGTRLRYWSCNDQKYEEQVQTALKQIELDSKKTSTRGIGRAVVSKETQYVEEVEEDRDYIVASTLTQSQVSIPLTIGNSEVIGVISIEHPLPRAFTAEDIQRMELLAKQAAAITEISQLIDHLQTAQKTLERIANVSVEGTLNDVIENIVSGVQAIVGCDWVTFASRITENGGRPQIIVVPSDSIVSFSLVEMLLDMQYGDILKTHPYATLEKLIGNTNIADFNELYTIDPESIIIIPLRWKDHYLGLLILGYTEISSFQLDDFDNIKPTLNQAAVAIFNARFINTEQTLRQQAEILQIASQEMLYNLNSEQVASSIFDGLNQILKFDRGIVQLIDGNYRNIIGTFGNIDDLDYDFYLRPLSMDPLTNEIIAKGSPKIISNVNEEPLWEPISGVNSWIGIPLAYDGMTIGFVSIEHSVIGYYSDHMMPFLLFFSNQAAAALANSRLLEERMDIALYGLPFIAISHEVKNTLAGIKKWIETYHPTEQDYISDVDDVIDMFTEILAKRSKGRNSSGSVESWITEIVKAHQARTQTILISLQFNSVAPNAQIIANFNMLAYVFKVLIENAKDSILDAGRFWEGEIMISVTQQLGRIAITISDNGSGIKPEILPLLFKHRIPSETGWGLGCLTAALAVQHWGGTITIPYSTQTGTSILIKLPISLINGAKNSPLN